MSGNRHGRDPFDDDRTEFIGRDEPTRRAWDSRDDQQTEFFGGAAGGAAGAAGAGRGGAGRGGYDPDADFGGGRGAGAGDGTRADGSGQYWAPLTPEERGLDPRDQRDAGAAGDPRAAGRGGYDARYDDRARRDDYADRDPRYDDRYDDRDARDDGGRKGGFGKGATIVAVTAIIAIVILVALMFRFLSGDDEGTDPTGTTPPPEPSTSETVTSASETSEPPTETSDPVRDELDRLRDEVNSLRETPPVIPGLGGGEVAEATVPEAVGKSPAEVELALRRAGFGDITILDANGNATNALSSLTATVATIDPPAGTATTTDQAITVTLE
ncbi:PASTA domain-containing protein [Corynebacterium sp. NPDC060344]|uniref:PASTA domain-containing protein n=1 Tax=Corynebacterium sp. NPDC060344 TaxID=3347101 RepID=UPI003651212B